MCGDGFIDPRSSKDRLKVVFFWLVYEVAETGSTGLDAAVSNPAFPLLISLSSGVYY